MDKLISFPNLGLEFKVGKSFTIFGLEIAYYGVIIAIAVLVAATIAFAEAKRTKQDDETYTDLLLCVLLSAIPGARLYYVMFEWEYYSKHISEIFNPRNGGLAIYGGIILAVLVCYIYTRIKKKNFLLLFDTVVPGLVIGQAIGRWGNFFNREAFGGYTDSLFAMELPISVANGLTPELINKSMGGYVTVHPTFLYESLACVLVFIIMQLYKKHKKVDGDMVAIYMIGYGIARAIIEGLRTDQLTVKDVAVSQVLSIILGVVGITFFVVTRIKMYKANKKTSDASES
ncbi:MAG: prolipoprotein diacylglyceryl transferase [Lachnospiraceae bacterium]|nr:prolipoprotein diacylglyceryl transferase [Lachnospiraceae bacterium]